MSNKQELALIKLYKGMPTADIEARLAGPDLIQLARGVAENELQKRSAAGARASEPVPADPRAGTPTAGMIAFVILLMAGLLTLFVTFFLHTSWGPVIMVIAAGVAAQVFGKAFPLVGKILAGLLLAAAVGIVVYVFTAHVSTEERILMGIFGCITALILVAMAGALVGGARNKQGWGAFAAELEQKQRDSLGSER